MTSLLTRCIALLIVSLFPSVQAAEFPAPVEKDWTVKDYRFRSGEQLPELRIHYKTIGSPAGEPVLVLHGTTQSSASMLAPTFGGELFGPGQA